MITEEEKSILADQDRRKEFAKVYHLFESDEIFTRTLLEVMRGPDELERKREILWRMGLIIFVTQLEVREKQPAKIQVTSLMKKYQTFIYRGGIFVDWNIKFERWAHIVEEKLAVLEYLIATNQIENYENVEQFKVWWQNCINLGNQFRDEGLIDDR